MLTNDPAVAVQRYTGLTPNPTSTVVETKTSLPAAFRYGVIAYDVITGHSTLETDAATVILPPYFGRRSEVKDSPPEQAGRLHNTTATKNFRGALAVRAAAPNRLDIDRLIAHRSARDRRAPSPDGPFWLIPKTGGYQMPETLISGVTLGSNADGEASGTQNLTLLSLKCCQRLATFGRDSAG